MIKLKLFFVTGSTVLLSSYFLTQLEVLVVLVFTDWVFGVIDALRFRRFNPQTFLRTILKLSLYFVSIYCTLNFDEYFNLRYLRFSSVIVSYFSLMEILSILSYCCSYGWFKRFPRFSYWIGMSRYGK